MLKFFSKRSWKLTNKNLSDIFKIKESHWKFGLKSQKLYFKKEIKRNDIHNLIYMDNKLIGYTLLRKLKKNKNKYLHFDTLIINKNFRNKGYSKLLMLLNNSVIISNKMFSILYCEKKLIKFYKKNGWKKIPRKIDLVLNPKKSKEILCYNLKK